MYLNIRRGALMMNKDWYTQQEVAKLLGVSKQTVYIYAKQGKIKKIDDPYRNIREVRYQKAEVDALLEQKKSEPVGYRPSEVAKILGVAVQTIYRYIQEGKIHTQIVPYGDERIRHVISEKGLQQARAILQKQKDSRIHRYEYYDSHFDIALYQKFSSDVIFPLHARIAKNKENEWVFYLPSTGETLSLERGFKVYHLKPDYHIHQEILPYKGYAHLRVPKDFKHIYELIDYLYRTWGIENVRLREEDRIIIIGIKEGEMPFISTFSFEEIQPFVIDGEFIVEDNILMIRSAYRRTTIDLPISLLEQIQKAADRKGMSMSHWIENVLEEYLKGERN